MLGTEIFKACQNITSSVSSEIFFQSDLNYNLLSNLEFAIPNVRSVFCENELISYVGTKFWNIVPLELKELTSVDAFKKAINIWKPKGCSYKLCKICVSNVYFIEVTI